MSQRGPAHSKVWISRCISTLSSYPARHRRITYIGGPVCRQRLGRPGHGRDRGDWRGHQEFQGYHVELCCVYVWMWVFVFVWVWVCGCMGVLVC